MREATLYRYPAIAVIPGGIVGTQLDVKKKKKIVMLHSRRTCPLKSGDEAREHGWLRCY
jgi:hypothetical protein